MASELAPVTWIVDDEPLVRRSIARLLGSAGLEAAEAADGEEFLSCVDAVVPGCVILDLRLPSTGGLQVQQMLADRRVGLPVIFLSGTATVSDSVHAMKSGAFDFLEKPIDADRLLEVVGKAIAFDTRRRAERRVTDAKRARLRELSPREMQLLPYLVSGRLNKQIACDLGVVEKTVKVHRAHVMQKLGLTHRADLVRFALDLDCLPSEALNPATSATPPRREYQQTI